ncbi:MAG: hypothetical protein ACI8W8_001413 [Rhodothermales bacterium]|jgi:hypothetical protein
MKTPRALLSLALFLIFANVAVAEDAVSLRLVHASNSGKAVDAALSDVSSTLTTNLPFSNYSVLDSKNLSIGQTVSCAQDFSVATTGSRESMKITVKQGGAQKLNTTVSLAPGKPLLLGGFPAAGGGKIILIMKLR